MYKILKKILVVVMCISMILSFTACNEKSGIKVDEMGNIDQSLSALNLEEDEQVGNFLCNLVDGKVFDFSKQKKPLLLNFWATW